MQTARDVMAFLTSHKAAGTLGKVSMGLYGLEVEIVRQGWNGPQSSRRVFPSVEIVRYGDESYLVDRKRNTTLGD